jgi:hypothetical protein
MSNIGRLLKGGILTSTGTDNVILPVGTNTHVLTADSGEASGVKWAAVGGGGSSVYFQAYRTSNQTVAGGNTSTTIIFDTAITNIGSGYDVATGIFTAPSTGFYSFSSTVFYNDLNAVAGITQMLLAYTGSAQSLRLLQQGIGAATTGVSIILTVAWSMPMSMNDTVKMQPFTDGTGNYTISGAALSSGAFNTSSTFSGFKVA